jgi:2-alkyl-3-oxoalkanoate reductase
MSTVATIARQIGVERLVYVSTAAVYGPGPFRDLPVDGASLRPASPASRTRAAAEQYVRDAGGLVVRPHLIYGQGDRWFLPALTTMITRLGAVIDGGRAVHSVIDVDTLAESLQLLSAERHFRRGSTLHINEPRPRAIIEILEHHARQTG